MIESPLTRSQYPWPTERERRLDLARSRTGWTMAEARQLLSELDLADLERGDLSIEAARHFLKHQRREDLHR